MKRKQVLGTLSLVLIGVIFGAVLVSGFGWVRPSAADIQIGSATPPVVNVSPDVVAFNNAFVEVANKVTPSIVQITVVSEVKNDFHDNFKFFFPFRDDIPKERQGGGSGVIISADGYILTNNHVVENASSVQVSLTDKRHYDATVVGTDPLTDLAVIKVDAKDLPAAYLGESDNVKVGEWVMAIGNPLSFSSTVTAGIVSAVGRSLNIIQDSYGVENFIQTDAAINPGNSGGALVNLKGEVIGINSAIATNGMTSSYIGYGFAIPIDLAKTVASDLIENGEVSRGYIGVRIEAVNDETAKAFGLDKPTGVLIQEVMKDGAASNEDIKSGDIILEIDGHVVTQPNELQSYVARKRAGDKVNLKIFRDGDNIERSVKLKAPDEDSDAKPVSNKKIERDNKDNETQEIAFDEIGLTVQNLKSADYKSFKVENGIKITDVKAYSKAFNQRLFKNLVIVEVDKKPIESVKDFEKIINSKKGKAILLKLADSEGTTRYVGLEIPS